MKEGEETILSIADAVRRGATEEVLSLCDLASKQGASPLDILRNGLSRGMHEVGSLYERHEFFLPELLISAEAMQAGVSALAPLLKSSEEAPRGRTVVLGVVQGDVHEIGKNLVGMMLEAGGFRVVDLGHDVPARRFRDAAKEHEAQVVALSTMMTTTLPAMQETIEAFKAAGDRPLVIVGGAPLSAGLARTLGADGYGESAARAPEVIEKALG